MYVAESVKRQIFARQVAVNMPDCQQPEKVAIIFRIFDLSDNKMT